MGRARPRDIAAEMVSRKMGKAAAAVQHRCCRCFRCLPLVTLCSALLGSATVAVLVLCVCVSVFLNRFCFERARIYRKICWSFRISRTVHSRAFDIKFVSAARNKQCSRVEFQYNARVVSRSLYRSCDMHICQVLRVLGFDTSLHASLSINILRYDFSDFP